MPSPPRSYSKQFPAGDLPSFPSKHLYRTFLHPAPDVWQVPLFVWDRLRSDRAARCHKETALPGFPTPPPSTRYRLDRPLPAPRLAVLSRWKVAGKYFSFQTLNRQPSPGRLLNYSKTRTWLPVLDRLAGNLCCENIPGLKLPFNWKNSGPEFDSVRCG